MSDEDKKEPEEEKKEPEFNIPVAPQPRLMITQELIQQGLSSLGKTFDGRSNSFTKLIIEGKEIDLTGNLLPKYINLRTLSLAKNRLQGFRDISHLPYLLNIDLSKNNILKLDGFDDKYAFQYLQKVNLSSNKISELSPIKLKSLIHLNLNDNVITTASHFNGHDKLRILELRKNKLKSLEGIESMKELTELYIAENELTSFEGLQNTPKLKKLHCRKNPIVKLPVVPNLPEIEYLNLRESNIESIKEIQSLEGFENLKIFNILGCPASEEMAGNLKKELIILMDKLPFKKINKEEVTEDEIKEALDEKKERLKQEEEAKLEAERQAKEKAEEEARIEAERIAKEKADEVN